MYEAKGCMKVNNHHNVFIPALYGQFFLDHIFTNGLQELTYLTKGTLLSRFIQTQVQFYSMDFLENVLRVAAEHTI